MNTAIFSDHIFTSSELNRRSGHVLDTALTTPVTITRNNDSFALLRRELMTNMAKEIEQTNKVSQLVNVVFQLTLGQEIESTNEFKWIEEFNREERVDLVNEVYEALNLAQSTDDWDEVAAVIHEWRESAIAVSSDELAEAFS
ncbi:hypothetical protein Xen7305DRAFT_00051650 [Xenococcus sp. PCC 7305]|uniref:hypothetical protein n=1 Tax=Xenococcus sp. PCC 7305 TaxID=102125 RepID=UPI0002AC03AC|nr:hypothetical protein [Xenococcus sp. PCC 7305]ELS05421.1 hypothetical protein Xen7305DRAFT_00051650 [Xenococcus sp. PCC 7305]